MRSALILAGGKGERFWPWSRPGLPKQLLPLAAGRILLDATLERVAGLVPPETTWILTSRDLAEPVRALAGSRARVVTEPVGRNTAPAIGLAAHLALAAGAEDAMAVLPSDALIPDREPFLDDAGRALGHAEAREALVTIGIRPRWAETGYGYIERGEALDGRVYAVRSFREKPDAETARAYLERGGYDWNSGMFFWRPRTFLAALERHRPGIAQGLAGLPAAALAAGARGDDAGLAAALDPLFPGLESISVDYAVLEPAAAASAASTGEPARGSASVAMVEAAFDWDDLGSWSKWAGRQPHDAAGNVVVGRAAAIESTDCVVVGGGERPVIVLGGRGLVVVQEEGGTLVCPREYAEDVRKAVAEAKTRGWLEGEKP